MVLMSLLRDPSKPDIIVQVPPDGKVPKAVVILLGWFGSKLRHVRKYACLYDERDCATITCSLDNRSLMLVDLPKIDELAVMVAKEAMKLLRLGDKIPLICHAFSNGGAIPLQRMENIMEEKVQSKVDHDVDDWKLLQERFQLGAEIFDSSPAFPDFETFRGAIYAALPNPVVAAVSFFLCAQFYHLMNFVALLQGKQRWAETYWSHWENCREYTPVQAYIYSTADRITKSYKLDELSKTRADKGVKVMVKRFDDSLHVQHMISHKAEYCGLIDEILSGATK